MITSAQNDSSSAAALPPPMFLAHMRDFSIGLTQAEMEQVLDCLRFALADVYVHLSQKATAFGTNIVGEIDVLKSTIPYFRNEIEFISQIQKTIGRLFDRHTTLVLPSPWKNWVAFLPVFVEPCWSQGRRKIIVTRAVPGQVSTDKLPPGIEITHWNGTPIRYYIEKLSWQNQGANPSARIALASQSLTVRPLGYSPIPDEDWATLTTWDGKVSANVTLPWMVIEASSFKNFIASRLQQSTKSALGVGLDYATSVVNVTRMNLYKTEKAPDKAVFVLQDRDSALINPLPDNLSVNIIKSSGGLIGYIRIFSFEYGDSPGFLTRFASLCAVLPEKLIIDVRGNPGGTIPSGEIILQLLGTGNVDFGTVQFRNTKLTKAMVDGVDLFKDWRLSIDLAIDTGLEYSQAIPLTKREDFPALPPLQRKKTLLIIDALCYSTTDFFVAGFRDNKLGPVIGVDPSTGAGGANVWGLNMVQGFLAQVGRDDLPSMPRDFDFNLAVRRSLRTGALAGLPLEGLGAQADLYYSLTERDILSHNEDLIQFACDLFDRAPRSSATP